MIQKLQPDAAIGLGDIPHGEKVGWRRLDKMFTRTERWMKEIVQAGKDAKFKPYSETSKFPAILAPVLPVTVEQQRWYLDLLADELLDDVDGLAIYDLDPAAELPEMLAHLLRVCLSEPQTPLQVLRGVAIGMDMITAPFLYDATDAGIALDFTFPAPSNEEARRLSLGVDMWLEEHATDVAPLVKDCKCDVCRKHSRAYIRHLLSAKEMLAWVLLQIHNLHALDKFFEGIRLTIKNGIFEGEINRFERYYRNELPEKTGKGPR